MRPDGNRSTSRRRDWFSDFIYRQGNGTWAQVAKVTGGLYTEDFGSSVTTTTKGNLIVVTDPAWTDPNNIDNTAGAVFVSD